MAPSNMDACVPKVCTDFVFDLYDSVTLSQIPEEQIKLYADFSDLNARYFSSSPWPSPQSIASECNGHPLFLALYRELTHRQWHAVSRPSIRDRCEGYQVYRELFEEILEQDSFYILPSWCFEILHEFVYQFQGFCQVRAAVYASARKHGLMDTNASSAGATASATAEPSTSADGVAATTTTATTNTPTPSATLLENWHTLQHTDAWDVESVFGYLNRLIQIGMPKKDQQLPVVYTYLSAFASVALSRLECLLGDYTACLQALEMPLKEHFHTVLPTVNDNSASSTTLGQVVNSVLGARISIAYHAGVSYLMLRRYKDAIQTLNDMCAGFTHIVAAASAAAAAAAAESNKGRKDFHNRGSGGGAGDASTNSAAAQQQSQLLKQYDRMICLLVILTQLVPNPALISDDATRKAIREKTKDSFSWEEFFASPKFISVSFLAGSAPFHRQQVQLFLKEMQLQQPYRTLRSYLKLYTSLPLPKLASFYDRSTDQALPLLLSYKTRMRQLQQDLVIGGSSNSTNTGGSSENGNSQDDPVHQNATATATTTDGMSDGATATSSTYKTAMDIHYYIVDEMVHIDEPEKQRRFETHFFNQIAHNAEVAKKVSAIRINY